MKSFEELLETFKSESNAGKSVNSGGKPITIWLPADAKARYDELQKRSKRRFSRTARELFIELIEAAEGRI